jgi:hypothetical protein
VARAIKVAREMALLPYSVRQVTQRSKGRRDRDRGERGDRDAPREATASDVAETEAADAEAIEGLDVLETGEGAPTIEALVAEEE